MRIVRIQIEPPLTRHVRTGFTLIEIMAVVLLMALLATILLPDFGIISRARLKHEAETLGATIELARQRAVVTGKPHRLVFDFDAQSYLLEWEVDRDTSGAIAKGSESEDVPLVDLRSPPTRERSFEPIPTRSGRPTFFGDSIWLEEIVTADGRISAGRIFLSFARDGTTEPMTIFLGDEADNRRALEVQSLAETVRITNAS